MGQGVQRTQRDYSLAQVEQIEKGELTCQQAQARYGIQGNPTILVWLRKHGRQEWSHTDSVCAPAGVSSCLTPPEQRIKKLEQRLALMSQEAQLFEAVVGALKSDLVPPKQAYYKTSHSFHRFDRHPKLLKAGQEQVTPVALEQVWIADITYLPART